MFAFCNEVVGRCRKPLNGRPARSPAAELTTFNFRLVPKSATLDIPLVVWRTGMIQGILYVIAQVKPVGVSHPIAV